MGILREIIARASRDRIIQGTDVDINVQFIDRLTREPIDLEGASGGSAQFAAADGTTITVPWAASGVSLLDADVGFVNVHLGADLTALLAAGESLSWEIQVDHGATTIAQFVEQLEVVEQLY